MRGHRTDGVPGDSSAEGATRGVLEATPTPRMSACALDSAEGEGGEEKESEGGGEVEAGAEGSEREAGGNHDTAAAADSEL